MINTCSSSNTSAPRFELDCVPFTSRAPLPLMPFWLVLLPAFPSTGGAAASGPDRMYPVREAELDEKSGRTYSCTIGLARGLRLGISGCYL